MAVGHEHTGEVTSSQDDIRQGGDLSQSSEPCHCDVCTHITRHSLFHITPVTRSSGCVCQPWWAGGREQKPDTGLVNFLVASASGIIIQHCHLLAT